MRCPHCDSNDCDYRYYSSESWTSTWRCDICERRIDSGDNYYHCCDCCDRGGSSHYPEVKRCSGMYCTSCCNDKAEKKKYEEAAKQIRIYEAAQNKQIVAAEKANKAAQTKCDAFLPKLQNMNNKYASNNESKSDDGPTIDLDQVEIEQNEVDELIQGAKTANATVQETIEFAKGITKNESEIPTYTDQNKLNENITKYKQLQQKMIEKKKSVHQQIEKINKKQIKAAEDTKGIQNEIIAAKKKEINLNKDSEKLDTLRSELNDVSGAEINANPAAFKKMKSKFDELCVMMRSKHSENKEKIAELIKCEEAVGRIQAKLEKQQSGNKYLIQLLDQECKRLCEAVDGAMKKFEQRGIYFLSVTLGLKQEIIEKFDEVVGDDLDMIKELEQDDLIDMGIDNKFMRIKILKGIQKLKKATF